MKRPTIAISDDFLSAFAALPKKKQARVNDFVRKFRQNPMSGGINYEKIKGARDENLRSVRIDREYRGIVLHPGGKGAVYILLWVDHHDEAYRWAKNRIAKIHPETGAIQIIAADKAADILPPEEQKPRKAQGLFDTFRDRQLLRLGVPEELLPLVRSVESEHDLDRIDRYLPQEASEGLFMLASGYSLEEALRELERTAPGSVDTSDFEAALLNDDSRRRFQVVEDELELQEILAAPLEKWRVFLHPTQRKLVYRDWNGPVRVLGGAGTGKTVAALHRAKWLAEKVFTGKGDKILFTTFTRNLAADIGENLKKICSSEAIGRIEVINLDKWVSDFLKRHGYSYSVDYGEKTGELWEEALSLAPEEPDITPSFFRAEWEKVIQPQEITTLAQYLKASRLGRGAKLNRKARKAIWPVFQEYMVLLDEHGLREVEDAMRDARIILDQKDTGFVHYSAIVVDEAQDMSAQAFRLLRKMVPEGQNDIFIAGDAHQRIYRHRVVLGQCGINIRGRGRRLRINYRTTEENRRWAVALLKDVQVDDLDGGIDDQKGYKSLMHGVMPVVRSFPSFEEEVNFIINYLKQRYKDGKHNLRDVCLVARTKNLLEQYASALDSQGVEYCFIKRSLPEDRNAPGVRIATMHRVKGLEFDRIIVSGVSEGIVPLASALRDCATRTDRKEIEVQERSLLYVAATRARKEVLVTCFGEKSPFLQ